MIESKRNDEVEGTRRSLWHDQENWDIYAASNYTFPTHFNACKN